MSATLQRSTTQSAATSRKLRGLVETRPVAREQRVRERALKIYEDRVRRGAPGSAEADWRRAEEEVAGWPAGAAKTPVRASMRERGEILLDRRSSD